MTGLIETRKEYNDDIQNGVLNYYDYEIKSFELVKERQIHAIVRLLAKVYGLSKSWWPLHMDIIFDESG